MKQSLRSWLWAVPVEQEVDEELAFHLDMHTRDLVAKGMDPRAARQAALDRVGDLQQLRRVCLDLGRKRDRTMRIRQWIDELRHDVTFSIRQLRASPGFAAVAILTLALGIGANSAIFALADATLLRPLRFAEADRLVQLHERTPTVDRSVVAPFEAAEWIARNRTFESMAAVSSNKRTIADRDGAGALIDYQNVGVRFFDLFRVTPIAGRTFLPEDDRPGSNVVVLSERLWRDRFGSDPTLVGRPVEIDGDPFIVIGIVPAGFQVIAPSVAWTVMSTLFMRGPAGRGHYLRVVGRLRPGTTLADARHDMAAVADGIAREHPDLNKDRGVLLEDLHDGLVDSDLRLTAKILLAIVAVVLLTCAANVANLVLARTSARARELAVRTALGAGGRRIVRLLLAESLVLSATAAAVGAALGAAILAAAPALLPSRLLPIDVPLAFDSRVLAFCAAAAFLLAVVFGAVPAWQATRLPPLQAMAAGGRTSTGGGSRLRAVLAMSQVAAAVALLCGAGLLLRSLSALQRVDSGSRTAEVLTMTVGLPVVRNGPNVRSPYATPDGRRQYYEAVAREVASVPGVRSAALGSALPLDGWWISMSFQLAGEVPRPEAEKDDARYVHVGPAYFRTMGIPIVSGREFSSADTVGSVPVCMVNEAFVRRFLNGRAPIGTRLVVRAMITGGGPLPVRDIVSVVAQVKERPDESDAQPHIYVPFAQDPPWQLSLVVQPTLGPASALTPLVRAAVARVDKARPVMSVRTIATVSHEATSPARFRAALVGAFAALALSLAVVGVFGILAYSVQQRVREFGVRMALGATANQIVALVVGDAARVIAGGTIIGLIGAALLGRSLSAFLFGVRPSDPVTFASAALVLAATAALAIAVPVLRAVHVDPIVTLRDE